MSFKYGIVKCVLSGDTVILRGKAVKGPPQERMVTLSYVNAPRWGKKEASNEHMGWESREYVRKRLVGKEVRFTIHVGSHGGIQPTASTTATTTSNSLVREYGCVWIGEENLVKTLLKEGYVKMKSIHGNGGELTEELKEMLVLEKEAQEQKKGLWKTKEDGVILETPLLKNLEEDAHMFLDKWKGKKIEAIVEQVRDGSTLRVIILPSMQMMTLMISGVKCPFIKRDMPDQPDSIAPFAEEAKFFTEARLLQRDVTLILEGLSGQNFVGSVLFPAGNIAEALLKEGLAKIIDWSIPLVTEGPQKLRVAEKSAKEKQLRLWQNYAPSNMDIEDKEFEGMVTRIINGESLIITLASGQEQKLVLSSLRQPRLKETNEASYNPEAKEFLRSRLIGKKVHVLIDYIKPPSEEFEKTLYATIYLGDININEAIVNKGLARVRREANDEQRASNYDELLMAEDKAIQAKKGMHSHKEPPIVRISDASESAAKAKQFFPFMKRSGRVAAVVEHVVNGGRLKILVPKENCKITFILSGIRCPKASRSETDSSEPFGKEALEFTSRKCLQYDVELELENLDKTGGFIGTLFIKGENLSCLLLKEGLAVVHPFSANQSPYGPTYYSAEEYSQKMKKNIWSIEREKEQENEEISTEPQLYHLKISEILDHGHFFAKILDQDYSKLDHLMEEVNRRFLITPPSLASFRPKRGEVFAVQLPVDLKWYRARLNRTVNEQNVEVRLIDEGTIEIVSSSDIRILSADLAACPAKSKEFALAYIQIPELDSEYGHDAFEFLSDILFQHSVVAHAVYRHQGIEYVSLEDGRNKHNLEEDILSNGFAFINRAPMIKSLFAHQPEIYQRLLFLQNDAKRRRINIWEYGDISPEDAPEFGHRG